jgi:HEAT repeat protein
VNTETPYPEALPILLEHLPRPYPERVREGIARALAVPDAKFAWYVLIRLYRQEQPSDAKDGLAVALAAAADDEVIDDVIDLVRDGEHGSSRLLLLSALGRSRAPQAQQALQELAADA